MPGRLPLRRCQRTGQGVDWGVSLRQGNHEPLVSFETYQRIQERLNGPARVPARKNINADFPLRGAVVCGHCGTPLTACWSKGRTAHHPYYLCPKGCESYRKSIRREDIEGEFEALLRYLQPTANLLTLAREMLEDLWNQRLANGEGRARYLKGELVKVEKQVEQFLDRIADATVPSVVAAYEARIQKLEEQKLVLEEKIAIAAGR